MMKPFYALILVILMVPWIGTLLIPFDLSALMLVFGGILATCGFIWSGYEYFNFISTTPNAIGPNHPFRPWNDIRDDFWLIRTIPLGPLTMVLLSAASFAFAFLVLGMRDHYGFNLMHLSAFVFASGGLWREWKKTYPPISEKT